jgi:hypothetical protein
LQARASCRPDYYLSAGKITEKYNPPAGINQRIPKSCERVGTINTSPMETKKEIIIGILVSVTAAFTVMIGGLALSIAWAS